LENQSIFEDAKLSIVENAFELEPKTLKALIQPFLENKSISILVSEHEKPVKALEFLKEKPVWTQSFEILKGPLWEEFIRVEAEKSGTKLDGAAVKFLGDVYAGNSWALATELQKLGSAKSSITKKDLDTLDLSIAPDYWPVLMGLRGKEVSGRLRALETLLAQSDPAAKIFNILASQWKEKTLQIADYDFAVKSGKLEYEEAVLDLVLG
jgi:DNA polymerase III delta subunit